MRDKNLADMLYVGRVYVVVGYDGETPTARTNDYVFGAMKLGGQISAELPQYSFGDAELDEDDPPYGSVGMWKNLLTAMRDMLARCFIFCEMQPIISGLLSSYLDDEDNANLDRAIEELGKEFFEVTPTRAIAAIAEREEADEHQREFWSLLFEYTEAQRARDDENLTIGEAMQRGKEGAENIRRIIEGEEEQK